MNQRYLIFDYETRSEVDLKKVGAFEYSAHPSTRILCAAWRLGTKEELKTLKSRVWSPAYNVCDAEFLEGFYDDRVKLIAHNALFEKVITENVLSKLLMSYGPRHIPARRGAGIVANLKPERWMCTAAMAAALALPRNLENACLALNLPVKKDMEGRRLMLKYSKPRRLSQRNSNLWHSDRAGLERLMLYCQRDVDAETELFLAIPELTPSEREIWMLDQAMNLRGFRADRPLVKKILTMIETEIQNLNEKTAHITEGKIDTANRRQALLDWINREGLLLPNLQAKTIAAALKAGVEDKRIAALLEIRTRTSKTSTAKYQAFEMRSRTDGVIRDTTLYHGASTGRFTGMGLQPHNFPKGTIKDTLEACEHLNSGDLEWVRLVYGNPMEVFSSCLRAMIVPPEGSEFFCADFNAIETRVLFWLARHEDGLTAYAQHRDLYREMAQVIYGLRNLEDVTDAQRQVGKGVILGCGYAMGYKKFHMTALNNGSEIELALAKHAVSSYRATHHPVPRFWEAVNSAAMEAVRRKGTKFKLRQLRFWVADDFLWIELPSGRKLAFYKPEIRWKAPPWAIEGDHTERMPQLYHYSVNPKTRKWECASTYGGKLVENIVQGVSRDFMCAAMVRIEAANYPLDITVHDEILAHRKVGEGDLGKFEALMAEVPSWGIGCPIQVKGWQGPRYKKG